MEDRVAEPPDANIEREATAPSKRTLAISSTFRSLRHRDYRFLWASTLFGSSAQWLQQVTMGWLTYDLTGSAFLLGAVNGFRALPLLVLGPFGGVAADRVDRKRLMLATQVGLFLVSFGFANLVVSGHVRVWHLFVFTMLTGLGWSFNMPVRQSVVPNLVPPEDLMNAVALRAVNERESSQKGSAPLYSPGQALTRSKGTPYNVTNCREDVCAYW